MPMLSELDLWFSQSAGWAHGAWAHAYEHRWCYVQVLTTRRWRRRGRTVAHLLNHPADTTPCVGQKATSAWSLLAGALGWVSGSDSHRDRAAGTDAQVSPDTKPSPRQSRAHECALWAPQGQDQKTVWKSITRGGQKSMELLTNSFRKLTMLMRGGQWSEFQI